MDEFLSPFWNLDQVFGWADTRDPELVRAAALPRYNRHIAIRSTQSATASMFYGRDIGGELWAASGWKPKIHPFEPPPILARRAEKRDVPAFHLYRYKDLLVDEPFDAKRQQFVDAWKFAAEADRAATAEILRDLEQGDISGFDLARLETLPTKLRDDLLAWLLEPEAQGPPNVSVREPFPTLKYLEYLFQTGRLTATAQVPGDPRSVQISKLDWSGLKIGVGGGNDRMLVWREGHFRTDGEGDLENLRLARDEVLREFPAERPEARAAEPHEANDDEIRAVIREAVSAKGDSIGRETLSSK